uniref:Uncharacterized protein n=1 Tax=Klebsiella pneumoniae TaxID=573 RepID=A0A8B0STV3_KLEPN|nr:hypothetical protein [Klebsiella pneumoniae]
MTGSPFVFGNRHRLPGHHRFINGCFAFDHDTVDRNTLSGLMRSLSPGRTSSALISVS